MHWLPLVLVSLIPVFTAPEAAAQSDAGRRAFEDCIVRQASRAPSPQAAVILQRACFYKYQYGKGYPIPAASAAEHRRLSKIYKPEVCDCLFERMPALRPDIPAAAMLDYCVENPNKPLKPEEK